MGGTVDSCCNSINAHDLGITIGTIPIQDNFEAPNMSQPVISGQPTSSQNGASSSIHPPFPKVTPMPYSDQPTAPSMPNLPNAPSMPSASNMPTAPMAMGAANAPSAPSPPIDFSGSKTDEILLIEKNC